MGALAHDRVAVLIVGQELKSAPTEDLLRWKEIAILVIERRGGHIGGG